jgi:hypothetical protein
VTLTLKTVALGIGGSSGEGVLNFKGGTYPFSISGMSLVDIGISTFIGAGKVYDLQSLTDLTGTYAASQATFAVAGGNTAMTMKNERGVTIVILKNEGQETGTQLSVGPAGMKITLR